jgi:hypothetical protein
MSHLNVFVDGEGCNAEGGSNRVRFEAFEAGTFSTMKYVE